MHQITPSLPVTHHTYTELGSPLPVRNPRAHVCVMTLSTLRPLCRYMYVCIPECNAKFTFSLNAHWNIDCAMYFNNWSHKHQRGNASNTATLISNADNKFFKVLNYFFCPQNEGSMCIFASLFAIQVLGRVGMNLLSFTDANRKICIIFTSIIRIKS